MSMNFKTSNLRDILFIDIETVPAVADYNELGENFKMHWDKKSQYFRTEQETAEDVYYRAGIYAEFGKIVCISVGLVSSKDNVRKLRVKSFYGDNEKELLEDFAKMLTAWDSEGKKSLCGHNVKEFDIPFISRRMLVNGLNLPKAIDNAGRKPWEVTYIDTLELWKFGDYKNFTSLSLLADLFGIPTPKDDIDGSQVGEVYYKEKNLDRIVAYCEKDVLAVANLFLKFKNIEIIPPENLEKAEN